MPAIQFAAESDESRSLPLNAQRLVNFFTEKQLPGAKSQTPLFGAPGLSAFADTSTITGAIAALGTITGGSGYGSGVYSNIPLTGGSGSGAIATLTVTGGAVTAVAITTAGINYQINDVLSASNANLGGAGSGFSVTVTSLSGRAIAALSITNAGQYQGIGGYSNVPLLGGSGTGATANITLANGGFYGYVSSVAIVNPGANYRVGDTLTPDYPPLPAPDVDAVITVTTLTGGRIASVGALVGGSGYPDTTSYFPNVPLTGGSGSGAVANLTLSGGAVSAAAVSSPGIDYVVGDILSAALGGTITTLGSLTGGDGYVPGTYTNVPLTGGSGSGAVASITVSNGVGTFGAITGGSGYVSGTYTNVPLTGGSGSGAEANILVSGGIVLALTLAATGADYIAGDTLSASNSHLGGSGSGFSVVVATVDAVTVVTITATGLGYKVADVLSASNANLGGAGSGFSVPVATIGGGSGFSVPVAAINTPGPVRGSWVKQDVPYVVAGDSLYQLGSAASGTYSNVPLTGGAGSGATANITINGGIVTGISVTADGADYLIGDILSAPLGSGTGFSVPVATLSDPVIAALGAITGGTGYVSGTYYGVPLTGGSGSNATATIVVTNGAVTNVTLTATGAGYVVGDTLSASSANLGGSGAGFSVPVAALQGGIATLGTITGGSNYIVGTAALVGCGIGGTDLVGMSDNGFQLCVVSGQAGSGWIYDTNPQSATYGFQQITDSAFYPANTVSYFDGYFIFDRIGTNEFFLSNLYDGTTYNALDYASAESQPDFVTGTIQNLQLLFIICQEHLELWYDAGSYPFPFARYTGAGISYGCVSPKTIIKQDGAIFFLGSDKIFYRLQSTSPIRISTHAIEHIIAQDGNIAEAYCFTFTLEGHKMVGLTLPASQRTLIFDISTGRWHERESWDQNNSSLGIWRGATTFSAFNETYVGDAFNGNVNLLDWTTYTELGNTIRGLAFSIPYHQDRKRLFVSRFELDIQAGVGTPYGPGSDPQIMLGWSVDGAETFAPLQFWRSMGRIGQYLQRLRWLRMGQGRQFVFVISCTDPVPRVIIAAHADISVGM